MKNRKRYTVRYSPTGAEKSIARAIGVFHAVFGSVFVIIGLCALPFMWIFGMIFTAVGAFFAANGIMIALGKNGLRRSYQIETETEEPNMSRTETHDHISSTALDTKRRLEQLESLKSAGLITDREFQQKRSEIIKEL